MNEPTFIIMKTADAYAAISNSHGHYYGRTLVGFGAYIRDEMRKRFGIESDEVEFTPVGQLTQNLARCATCAGTSRVETDGVAGQYLQDEFGTIDWSL